MSGRVRQDPSWLGQPEWEPCSWSWCRGSPGEGPGTCPAAGSPAAGSRCAGSQCTWPGRTGAAHHGSEALAPGTAWRSCRGGAGQGSVNTGTLWNVDISDLSHIKKWLHRGERLCRLDHHDTNTTNDQVYTVPKFGTRRFSCESCTLLRQ